MLGKIWTFLNGHKTEIAIIASVTLSVLNRRGIEIDPIVFDITDSILGVGLVHKGVKLAKGSLPTASPPAV